MSRKQKKALIEIIVAAVLFALAKFLPLDNVFERIDGLPEGVWETLIFLPAYIVAGRCVLWSALRNITRGQVFDENFLMAIASVGAMATGDGAEGAVVMIVYRIGELFESYAVGKSRRSISALMDIRPDHANLVAADGTVNEVTPETVHKGDIIEIKPGERVPLDGKVISGSTQINTVALTGEPVPVKAAVGDTVMSGSVNINGVIRLEVSCDYHDSTVARILDLVENSAAKKAKSEKFITRFAKYYTPAVCAAAVLLAVVPPIFAGDFVGWLHRALTLLVISCPCALVISVPLSFFAGLGAASKAGVLIKGSDYIERLSKVKTVLFDKTGTLTNGSFGVVAVHPEKISELRLLELAAKAECCSDHPISRSITEAYGGVPSRDGVSDIEELSGRGISAVIDGEQVLVGNGKLMDENGIKWHKCHQEGTQVHVAHGGEYAGHIVIFDEIKPDSKEAIDALKASGVRRIIMLTGDSEEVAETVAEKLGITEWHSGLLPADKVALTEQAKAQSDDVTAFVGDGINDAPVLARADIGISMGLSGSQAAIEASDVVLTDDKPSKIARSVRISRRTMKIVYQNIVFSLGVKLLVIVLAAFGLAGMWTAVFADVGVMILAVLNSLRALYSK